MKSAKTEIVYLDDEHNVVDESVATQVFIRELDENGNLINSTYMVRRQEKPQRVKEEIKLTQEDIDFINQFGLNIDQNNKVK